MASTPSPPHIETDHDDMSMQRIVLIILVALNAIAFAGIEGWLGRSGQHSEPERLSNQLNPERIRLATDASGQGLQADTMTAPEASESIPEIALPPVAAPQSVESTDAAALPDVAAPPAIPDTADGTTPAAVSTATAEPPEAEQAVVIPSPAPPPPEYKRCVAWSGLNPSDADTLVRRLRRSGAEPERSKIETPSSWWVRIPPQGSREQADRRVQELRALGVNDVFIVQEAGPSQYAISLGVFKTESRARQLLNQLRNQGVRNAGVEPRMSTTHRVQASLAADTLRGIESGIRGIAALRTPCTPSNP